MLGTAIGRLVDTRTVGKLSKYGNNDILRILEQEEKTASRGLGGIKIDISGKLTTAGNRPRYTVRSYNLGSISGENLTYSQFTTKNKLGAYTVKV